MKKQGKPGKSINRRFMQYTSISVLVLMVLLYIGNFVLQRSEASMMAIQNYQEINRLAGEYLGQVVQGVEKTANRLAFDKSLQSMLDSYSHSPLNSDYVHDTVSGSIIDSSMYNDIYSNIVILDAEGDFLTSMHLYQDTGAAPDWLEAAWQAQGRAVWLDTRVDANDSHTGNQRVVSVVKMIRYARAKAYEENYGQCIGYLLLNIREADFFELIADMRYGQSGSLYLVNEAGVVLSSAEKSLIGSTLPLQVDLAEDSVEQQRLDGQEQIVATFRQPVTGWSLVGLVQLNELTAQTRFYTISTLLAAAVIILLLFVVLTFSSRRVNAPLIEVQEQMARIARGDFDTRLEPRHQVREVDNLITSFNTMAAKLDDLVKNIYEVTQRERRLELQVTQAQLRILQQQMNPHFLYNTLDSISWMATLSGKEQIANMVTALGSILRASVNVQHFAIPVAEELKLLERYIYIQSVRYAGKLRVEINAAPLEGQPEILKFMLQLLVENAIIHGIGPKTKQLLVEVDIHMDGEALVVSVRDNGVGMAPEVAAHLFERKPETPGAKTTGTGCANVYDRLVLTYGDGFACTVDSAPGRGTCITVRTPAAAPMRQNSVNFLTES